MEWPLDLPARTVLSSPTGAIPRWAEFDAAWYQRTYGLADDQDAAALLDHYLTVGQAQGYSPNRLFDEAWHRAEYSRIAAAVATGEYSSAFDAYCRRGCLDRSGHWLFDELGYRGRYHDLTRTVLAGAGLANGYEHYLRHGVHEGRIGHLLFDPDIYLANVDPAEIPAVQQMGAFQHYLNRLEQGAPELRTSVYFDPHWYKYRYPQVARAIGKGRWKSALHHYLCNDTPTEFDPLEWFSEDHYLGRDPVLREVVAKRQFRNGYMHFLHFGARELRSPSTALDLAWYADQPAVQSDVQRGLAADPLTHWLKIGSRQGLSPVKHTTHRVGAEHAAALAEQITTALLPTAGRFGYRFDQPEVPAVSVVLVVRDAFAATMATIGALRASTTLPLELIIVDLASTDETAGIGQYVPGAKVLRLDAETTWSRAADAGRQWATAPLVLFLSGTAHVGFNAIHRACTRLDDSAVGAVGGMVLQPHGLIAQAGGIVWQDGGTHHYMAGQSPLAPEANFVRAVDFLPATFLLVRADLMTQLGGFDDACGAGYEAIDLCLRINAAGLRVMYDPSVVVTESVLSATHGAPSQYFRDKHAAFLDRRPTAGGPIQVFARHAVPRSPRILFIEDTIPLRRLGSGFVRSNDIVRAMAGLGATVTVFPVNGCTLPLAGVFGDMPDTVEVMHNQALDTLANILQGRLGYYDLIWVARTHNLEKIRPILDRVYGQDTVAPPVILDTEALTPYREALRIALTGGVFDPEPGMRAVQDL
ncbi:MAG TPA: glycosyltransferase, partial [Rhodopila sp.]|nr:glycosyltransferase [Rhodopila sp.]